MDVSNLKWATPGLVERAQAILNGLTLQQKIGQVMCIGIDGYELEDEARELIQKHAIGGIILFGRNIRDVDQVGWLVYDIQRTAREAGHPGLFIAIDQEGGRVLRLNEEHGFTEVLSAMGMGATGDPIVAYITGTMLAQEMKAVGINWNLAPTTTISNAAALVRGDKTRSFGSDPEMVGRFANEFIRGIQDNGVMACAKGFPGTALGVQGKVVDSHLELPVVPAQVDDLEKSGFIPLRQALKAKPDSVMMAHVYLPEIEKDGCKPASVSPVCMQMMRESFGFQGLLITDSLEMGALPEAGYPVERASAAALAAGADVLLHQRNHADHRRCLAELAAQSASGAIPPARLDAAVLRILIYKLRYGLTDLVAKDPQLKRMPGVEERRAQARTDATRAITLLRNQRHLLPLSGERKVLVIEYGPAHGTTWMPGIAQPGQIRGLGERLGAETYVLEHLALSDEELAEIVDRAAGKTVIAITSEAMESDFQQRLIAALHAAIEELIVVAMRGPYDIRAFPYVHTYLASYGFNPAHRDALVAVLKGECAPQGKLPVDIEGIFPRGSGLTY